jgi:hypothetical protein
MKLRRLMRCPSRAKPTKGAAFASQQIFNAGASNYNFSINNPNTVTFTGAGIVNGNAAIIRLGGGNIDLSGLTSAGMAAGAINGAGTIFLVSKNLTVGGNTFNGEFSGSLRDSLGWLSILVGWN